MKSGFYSILNAIVSDLSIACCFLPLFLVLWKEKLGHEKTFLWIGIYWMANAVINLPVWVGHTTNYSLQNNLALFHNLVDTPLAILIFYFSSPYSYRKILFYTLISFISVEIIFLLLAGYNSASGMVIIGVGSMIIFCFSIIGIVQFFQIMEHTPFQNTMGYVYAGFLFGNGLFLIIYSFNYLDSRGNNTVDNFFLYYVSLILSVLLASYGLWTHRRATLYKV